MQDAMFHGVNQSQKIEGEPALNSHELEELKSEDPIKIWECLQILKAQNIVTEIKTP